MRTLLRNNHEQNRRPQILLGAIILAAVLTVHHSKTVSAFSSTSTSGRSVLKFPNLGRRRENNSKTHLQRPWAVTATASDSGIETVASDLDTISTPTSLMEEEMLSGPEQSLLIELEEPKRRKIWKQLEKDARRNTSKSKSKSGGGGGFGGGGFGGKSKKPGAKGKKKGTTTSGGFGGMSKTSGAKGSALATETREEIQQQDHSAFDLKQDKSRFGAVIVKQGVARINGRLSKETAASLLDFVNGYLEEALTTKVEDMTLEEIYKQQPYFADVREKLNRWDMLLPLEESDTVQQALWELLVDDTVLSDSIESILGPAAQLYEMGSLISDPGSERQLLHADYNYQPDFQPDIPPALTCFVALQDIDESMGPTTFLPSSATEEYHEEIAVGQEYRYGDGSQKSKLLSQSTNHLSTLGTGDCALYNPMTLHCGGANRSDKRRVIFYFSFKNKKYDEKDWPLAYASLRPDLRARGLTLSDIQRIVTEHQTTTGN